MKSDYIEFCQCRSCGAEFTAEETDDDKLELWKP
jgi:hypothetical protein